VPDSRSRIEVAAPILLPPERIDETVDALCDAFHDYPVMTYVVGNAGAEYDRFLRELVRVFVMSRILREDPVLGIEEGGRLVAIATTTSPGDRPVPSEIDAIRDAMWKILGAAAKTRQETLVEVWQRLEQPGHHVHLNMLGVRRSRAGRGLGGRLLNAVHAMSRTDPRSSGVTLSTEDPKNVALYRHFGYEIIGYDRVTDDLETWQFFRPNESANP
jgi:ribosomal protein S18 acetylase RimI-like enzyme